MLKRLAAFQRQNQLDLALQELGRIERTLFMLDWLESPQLRQLCQAGLNKSEQRHALAQVDLHLQARAYRRPRPGRAAVPCLGSQPGDRRDRLLELDLSDRCPRSSPRRNQAASAELLAHTSPLTWEHIGFSGDFLWDRAAATAGQRRPLNLSREKRAA